MSKKSSGFISSRILFCASFICFSFLPYILPDMSSTKMTCFLSGGKLSGEKKCTKYPSMSCTIAKLRVCNWCVYISINKLVWLVCIWVTRISPVDVRLMSYWTTKFPLPSPCAFKFLWSEMLGRHEILALFPDWEITASWLSRINSN